MTDTGHNSVNANQLRTIIERVEKLDEELRAINEDKSEIFKEAKGNGFDTKIIKQIISIRRADPEKIREQTAVLEIYLSALGMVE